MDREELERELVLKDKQTLINDCLKLWDNNVELVEVANKQAEKIHDLEVDLRFIGPELERVTNFSGVKLIGAGFKRIVGL